MILGAESSRQLAVEHQLDVISPVRYPQINPTQNLRIAAAAPGLFKAENIFIKRERFRRIADQKSQVIDRRRDSRVRQGLPRCLRFHSSRQCLNEFDQRAVRILDLECVVAGPCLAAVARLHIKPLRPQVRPHLLDVIDREAQVAHHIWWCGWRIGKQLDMLAVVDLDERDTDLVGPRLLKVVGLAVSKQVVPEAHCLGKVGDKVANMRDPCNPRALRRCALSEQ